MAQITIDIPDDLAQQLAPFQNQFPDLFIRLIATPLLKQPTSEQDPADVSPLNQSGTYQEILDFLISQPNSVEIINFKVSEASQNRLQTLLQRNRDATLTPSETSELNLYQQLDTLLGFLKIRAYTTFNATAQN